MALTDTYPPTQPLTHKKVYNITTILLLSFSDVAGILNERKKINHSLPRNKKVWFSS